MLPRFRREGIRWGLSMKKLNVTRLGQLLLGASIVACLAAPARAQQWSFSTGVDYTSGDYGEAAETTIYQIPLTATYRGDSWAFSASVPYVDLEGTGNIVPGAIGGAGGGVGGIDLGLGLGVPGPAPAPLPPGPATLVDEQGLGDVMASFAWAPWQNGLSLGLSARLPTGDEEKSLGAGETIGSFSVNYAAALSDAFSLYGGVGYGHAFESDTGGTFAGIGAQAELSPSFSLGAGVDWAEATTTGFEDATLATVFADFAMSEHASLSTYVSAGLTDTSPESGAGLRVRFHP
jgi:hypothetical protein